MMQFSNSRPFCLLQFATLLSWVTVSTAQVCPGQAKLTIEVITDAISSRESKWEIFDGQGNIFSSKSSFVFCEPDVDNLCINLCQDYTFTMTDVAGDGMGGCGGGITGYYELTINDDTSTTIRGGEGVFSQESHVIRVCTPPTSPPTSNPTLLPTSNPTSPPTSNPTSPPTSDPTSPPTSNPTSPPTSNPTSPPTSNPTSPPTSNPTSPPTSNPTSPPTSNPTSPPTGNPTSSPTGNPTSPPTGNPTSPPTGNPTSPPTSNPTSPPTSNPTSPPTSNPTSPPTSNPSTKPTSSPTNNPTSRPTATTTNTGSGQGEWYVRWTDYKCVMNCDGAPPCGGIADPNIDWDFEMYISDFWCCSLGLSWMNLPTCIAKSNAVGPAGSTGPGSKYFTYKFYVDWSYAGRCVQDCPTQDGGSCVTPPENLQEHTLFDTAESCCQFKLYWINLATCVAASSSGGGSAGMVSDAPGDYHEQADRVVQLPSPYEKALHEVVEGEEGEADGRRLEKTKAKVDGGGGGLRRSTYSVN